MDKSIVVISNRIHIHGELPEKVLSELRLAFTHVNPQWQKLRSMGFPTYAEPRLLETWEGQGRSLPRGGMPRVRAILSAHGIAYKVSDRRASGERAAGEYAIPDYRRSLWAHQARAVDALIERENCLLRAPTGSGKTTVGLALIAALKVPAIIVVWTGSLFDQWMERITSPVELGIPAREVGMIRGSTRRIRPVTVAMQQTLAKKGVDEELRQSFGCLILDEVQRAPAKTVFDSIDPFPARYRFGISADESRKDRKEVLVYDLFGQVACEITRDEVENAGHTLDVEVRLVSTHFRADWWAGDEESGFDEAPKSIGETRDFGRLLDEMIADEKRERIIEVQAVEHAKAGRQVIVFTRRREHAQKLEQRISAYGIRCGLLLGGAGEDERVRRATIEGIRDRSIMVGVGTIEAIGTGTDLPSVEVGIIAVPLAGNRQLFGQVRGRVCRTSAGKKKAILVTLLDEHVFPYHRRNLLKWNRTVTERVGNTWTQIDR